MYKEDLKIKGVIVFTEGLTDYIKSLDGVDFKTVLGICKSLNKDNTFVITPSKKKTMGELAGISNASIGDSLRKLCSLDIIVKITNTLYLANPFYICHKELEHDGNIVLKYNEYKDA